MNHEFGHIFDFANKLNKTTANSWTEFSWLTDFKPLPEFDYPLRNKLCYYFCKGQFIDPKDAVTLFNSLMKTNFLSTYASRHHNEDWAESFALYLSIVQMGLQYEIHIQGQTFDMTKHFYSPIMKSKRDYVENFLKGPIIYPGE